MESVAPELIAPAAGRTVATDTPQLAGSAVDGADAYQVQVSENAGFSAVIVNEPSVAGTTTTVTLPGDGDYWWRVRAKAGADDGPWSEIWQFEVALDACLTPAVPTLLSPANGSDTDDLTPTFTWDDVANAPEYEIIIGEKPGPPGAIMIGQPTAPDTTLPPSP